MKYVPKLKKAPTKPDCKWCVKCGLELPVGDFKPNQRLKSGLSSWCIPCEAAYDRRVMNEKYASDPHFKWKAKERQGLRDVLYRSGLLSDSFEEEFVSVLGCSVAAFKLHIESMFEPGMTWANYGKGVGKWSLDHRQALDKSEIGDNVNHFTNLQPMWYSENSRKGAK